MKEHLIPQEDPLYIVQGRCPYANREDGVFWSQLDLYFFYLISIICLRNLLYVHPTDKVLQRDKCF